MRALPSVAVVVGALAVSGACLSWDDQLARCRNDAGQWVCRPPDSGQEDAGIHGACPGAELAEGWCWENPLPYGGELGSVWANGSGDIWVAGSNAILLRYDGARWTARDLSPVLGGADNLTALVGGGLGDVYLGTSTGRVRRWDGETWADLWAAVPPVRQLALGSDGVLWLAHGNGVGRLGESWTLQGADFSGVTLSGTACFAASSARDGGGERIVALERCGGGVEYRQAYAGALGTGPMWTDSTGRPWMTVLSTGVGGLVTLTGDGGMLVPLPNLYAGAALDRGGRSVAVGFDGTIAVTASEGSTSWRGQWLESRAVLRVPSHQRLATLKGVHPLFDGGAAQVAVAGEGGFLASGPADDAGSSGWTVHTLGPTLTLGALDVAGGTVMVGAAGPGAGGLYARVDGALAQLFPLTGAPTAGQLVGGLHVEADGRFLAAGAFDAGLVYRDTPGGPVRTVRLPSSVIRVRDVWGRGMSDLVLVVEDATTNTGAIYEWDGGLPRLVATARPNTGVFSRISGNAAGDVWAMGNFHLLWRRFDGGWSEVDDGPCLNCRSISVAPDGTVWLGGPYGWVFVRAPQTGDWKRHTINLDLKAWFDQPIADLVALSDGGAIVASATGNLAIYREGRWAELRRPGASSLSRLRVADGWLWASGEWGALVRLPLPP